MTPWLAVIGIGEDGLAGLAPTARALVAEAQVLVGGARHLAMVPAGAAERLAWRQPLAASLPDIAARKGRRVVVLASGDPLWYGVGALLAEYFGSESLVVLPQPGAFSLAASRMRWPLAECATLSVHGRPLERLALFLAPGARLLILSEDGGTPARVARLLADDAFRHDGQITKRVVRAATLAALAPLPGERLWDVGAGSGSIAIEWLRGGGGSAIAVERASERAAVIAANAALLGVPELEIVTGEAPEVLRDLAPPDAVFIGGGTGTPGLFEAAWQALRPGGRLVANAVTTEAEARLLAWHGAHGGRLARISVSEAAPLGAGTAWRPLLPVTQLVLVR